MIVIDFVLAHCAHFFAPFLSLLHSRIYALISEGILCEHFVRVKTECIECLMEEEYKANFERKIVRNLDSFFFGQ